MPFFVINIYTSTGVYIMPDKKIKEFDLHKALEKIITPSIFDQFVKEIDADEIPTDYIEKIVVYYYNGTIVELSGDEIEHPVPVNKQGNADDMDESFKKMREVKVIVNTEKLEKDVNNLLEDLIGDRC